MRSRFWLIPAAIIASAPAEAAVYLTLKDAQALLFPKASFTEDFRLMTDQQMRLIQELTDLRVPDRTFRLWRVSTGDWFVIDQVFGKDDTVYYALGLSPEGKVLGIEVLECMERWCQVRDKGWRGQFKGWRRGSVKANGGYENIAGTTLSSRHISEGITRVLTTFALLVLEQQP